MENITNWRTGEIISVARKLYQLSAAEWGIAALLADYWNANKQAAWPKVGDLAEEVGWSKRQVKRVMAALAARHMRGCEDGPVFLARSQPSPHAPNDYTFPWLRSEEAQQLLNARRTPKAERPAKRKFTYQPRSKAGLAAMVKADQPRHAGSHTVTESEAAQLARYRAVRADNIGPERETPAPTSQDLAFAERCGLKPETLEKMTGGVGVTYVSPPDDARVTATG